MAKFLVMVAFILSTRTLESVCAMSETVSSMWQSTHSALKSLGDDAHSYLVSLFGKQTVDTLLKTIGDGIKKISQAVAHTLEAVAARITELLGAAGIDAKPQKLFTPEGVVFVAQWALLAVSGYWLLSLAVWLFAFVIRQALFPLKFIFAIGKVFKNVKGLARRLKDMKRKRKQKMRATKTK